MYERLGRRSIESADGAVDQSLTYLTLALILFHGAIEAKRQTGA